LVDQAIGRQPDRYRSKRHRRPQLSSSARKS
jgi:hypothetical protein